MSFFLVRGHLDQKELFWGIFDFFTIEILPKLIGQKEGYLSLRKVEQRS